MACVYGPIEARAGAEGRRGRQSLDHLSLAEGKNREVRKVLEALGLTVNRLIRVAYGPFQLGDLKPGEVEEVDFAGQGASARGSSRESASGAPAPAGAKGKVYKAGWAKPKPRSPGGITTARGSPAARPPAKPSSPRSPKAAGPPPKSSGARRPGPPKAGGPRRRG